VLARAAVPEAALSAPHANHLPSDQAAELTRAGADRIRSWGDPALSAFADEVVGHIGAVTSAEADFAQAQRSQLVHGDFWDNNVLFTGDALTAVIDFDFMAERWRIDDLALPIYFYLLEPGRGLPTDDDLDLVRDLVDAYDSGTERPLSEQERMVLPLAIARQPAWSVGRWVLALDDVDARPHARSAADEFPVARAVLSELQRWQTELSAPIRRVPAPRPWR
jgi:homoserine kinase type II